MSAKSKGLGRGLGALLRDVQQTQAEQPTEDAGIKHLPTSSIVPNPSQPRQSFSEDSLQELAHSIQEQGILQPILVRPSQNNDLYEIIAGERRWRASKKANITEVPVIIKDITDEESYAIALIENLQREDLNPIEEAVALQGLKNDFDISQDELSKRIGKSRSSVANSLRLLNLSSEIQEDIKNNNISSGHARAILAVTDTQAQLQFSKLIKKNNLTVREAEHLSTVWKETGSFKPQRKTTKEEPPAYLQQITTRLTNSLNAPVVIKGSSSKGSINIKYSTEEELNFLLSKLNT